MKASAVSQLFCIAVTIALCLSCTKETIDERTLTIDEYTELGVPDPGKEWDINDLSQAYFVLGKIKWDKPYQLPMKNSKKSGVLFNRMLSPDNLSFLDNDKLSLNARAEQIQSFLKVPAFWQDVYSNPVVDNYYHREHLAIQIFTLNTLDGMVGLGVKILASEDPTAVSLQYAVPSIKLDYLTCIDTTLKAHKEPSKYMTEDLERVSDSVYVSLTRNKPWMDSTAVAKVRTSLNAVIDNTSSDYVREKYSKLEKSL
jgi:hypothetical protein